MIEISLINEIEKIIQISVKWLELHFQARVSVFWQEMTIMGWGIANSLAFPVIYYLKIFVKNCDVTSLMLFIYVCSRW